MGPTKQHPEIRLHNRIIYRNVHHAAYQQINYILYTKRCVDHIWTSDFLLTISKTFSSLKFALQAMVCCRPVHKYTLWPTQAGRRSHVVRQSVCERGKWELSSLIALQTWVSAPLREAKCRLHRKQISQSNYHHLQWWRRIVCHGQIYVWWQTCSSQLRQAWFSSG